MASGGLELHSDAVHAVALTSGRRAVGENMAQMPAAMAAMHFRAGHEEAAVLRGSDGAFQRSGEARPASAAFELGIGRIERLSAPSADEGADALFRVQRAAA